MKVTLIDYTGAGRPDAAHYAAALLSYTKNTRLTMGTEGFVSFLNKPYAQLEDELRYMAGTIPSSWEFVDYTFQIEDVTRAFTHQFVRTRTASYAQQTMRVLDVSEGSGWDYLTGPTIDSGVDKGAPGMWHGTMETIAWAYKSLIGMGVKVEDARGVLPTNILTNITVKMNMRTFVEMARKRSSIRTQGEYRDVLDGMKREVARIHPWIELFLERTADKAIADLERKIDQNVTDGQERIEMIKLLDILREQL